MFTKTLRGGDIKVYINGRPFAPVTTLTYAISLGRHAINGIDQTTPFELAVGQTKITGSMSINRMRRDGGLEGAGIIAPESVILREKYFSLAVVDRATSAVILYIEECAPNDQNWTTVARGLMSGSFTWEGIGWGSEIDT